MYVVKRNSASLRMNRIKVALCLGLGIAFAVFALLDSGPVAGQSGGEPLAAPTGVRASDNVYNTKVMIEWDVMRGATNYRVFRSAASDPSTAIPVASTPVSWFLDNQAAAGTDAFLLGPCREQFSSERIEHTRQRDACGNSG